MQSKKSTKKTVSKRSTVKHIPIEVTAECSQKGLKITVKGPEQAKELLGCLEQAFNQAAASYSKHLVEHILGEMEDTLKTNEKRWEDKLEPEKKSDVMLSIVKLASLIPLKEAMNNVKEKFLKPLE